MSLLGLVVPPVMLWDELTARVQENVERTQFERIPISDAPLHYFQEHFQESDHTFNLGTFHITDKTDKIKYLHMWPYTAGEYVHEYLTLCEELTGRQMKWVPTVSDYGKAALFFRGPSRGTYAYVDITSCYFSLYRYCAFDARYRRDKCQYSQGNVLLWRPDEYGMHKLIRNMTFGMMRKSKGVAWKNGKYTLSNSHSRYYRPDVTGYVLDTVQAIAQESLQLFDLHMWLTDAAILPIEQAKEFQIYLQTEWSLSSTIKGLGPAGLFSSNCFQVGSLITEQLKGFHIQRGQPINTLEPVNVPKLKRIRQWLVASDEK
jgi:hypothetical protein